MNRKDIQSANGQIFLCKHCSRIHLEFNGIGIDFANIDNLQNFYHGLAKLNGSFYEQKNGISKYRRKIIIPFPHGSGKFLHSNGELNELKALLKNYIEQEQMPLSSSEIARNIVAIQNSCLN